MATIVTPSTRRHRACWPEPSRIRAATHTDHADGVALALPYVRRAVRNAHSSQNRAGWGM